MPTIVQPVIILSVSLMLLLTTAAVADDTLAIRLYNDGADDIVVTVYDMTVGPNAIVLSHARVNGFTTIPLSFAPDAAGRANVSWTAVTAGANGRKCGHADHLGLRDSASVTVRADSNCPASQPASTAASNER